MKKLLLGLLLTVILILSACGGKTPSGGHHAENYTSGLVYAENELGDCAVTGYEGADTDVIIPDTYDGMRVTSIANSAFAGNTDITSLTLGANVTVIEAAAFVGCEKLADVNLSGSLEMIGNAAFFGCESLKSISLPITLKQVGIDAFASCPLIERVNYDGNAAMWSKVSVAPNNLALDTSLVLADGGVSVRIIDSGECNANISWRLGYDKILYISGNGHIPDYNFDEIPWGAHCDLISKIVVGEGIDIIGKNAFLGCYKLESVELSSTIRLIDNGAFYGCRSLSRITLPERLRRIGESAFFGCKSLVSVSIPESVTAIGSGAFMECAALEDVKLPKTVTEIERWCFANCQSLKTIDLSNIKSIGANAFFGCEALG